MDVLIQDSDRKSIIDFVNNLLLLIHHGHPCDYFNKLFRHILIIQIIFKRTIWPNHTSHLILSLPNLIARLPSML